MTSCGWYAVKQNKTKIFNLFTLKSYMYIHLKLCKQMTDVKLLVTL